MARNLPLHPLHLSSGARFAAVSDWFLVDCYSTPNEEFQAIIENGGMYDASADSRIRVSGEGHAAAINKLVTCSMADEGQTRVLDGFVCNDRGGVIDALEILQGDRYTLLHGSFTTRAEMTQWWRAQLEPVAGLQVVDTSETQGSIILIGHAVDRLLENIVLDGSLPSGDNSFGIIQVGQARCLALRRRACGQPCWRLDTGSTFLEALWNMLASTGSSLGIVPVGWKAMEMLRIESGVPRMGTEIDDSTTPMEIGAIDRVDFEKRMFPGRRALLHSTCGEFSRRLVHLEIEGTIPPAPGSPLETEGVRIGRVTSAMISPRQNMCFALGFVDSLRAVPGIEIQARTLDHLLHATVRQGEYLNT